MRAFLCHASADAEFVIQVARQLKASLDEVFYYEDHELKAMESPGDSFVESLQDQINNCELLVVFVGEELTDWQRKEMRVVKKRTVGAPKAHAVFVQRSKQEQDQFLSDHSLVDFDLVVTVGVTGAGAAATVAQQIVTAVGRQWRSADDLPLNPHLFSYEKDIIDFFKEKARLGDALHHESGEDWVPPESSGDNEDDEERSTDATANDAQEPGEAPRATEEQRRQEEEKRAQKRRMLIEGCPSEWPRVERWEDVLASCHGLWPDIRHWKPKPFTNRLTDMGRFRPHKNRVVAAALSTFHVQQRTSKPCPQECLIEQDLCFREAGPRKELWFPPKLMSHELHVAILVSGGIAPGINAVIDGIVQRHWLYARRHHGEWGLTIHGLRNGFRAFESFDSSSWKLAADHRDDDHQLVTSDHANEGGSVLGTSRVDELIDPDKRHDWLGRIVGALREHQIDILYVIGGDGSMKAAHAVWSSAKNTPGRPLSVVAIPKTMDNDILWVWQAFGFLSAVEKAREVIEQLHTEVRSNPRLCVLQLFGSDSGFVVSHSVLASATGHCDVALIPEVRFSMTKLAQVVKTKMCRRRERIPHSLVVMAETAIPTDATQYAAPEGEKPAIDIGLDREEQDVILRFDELRERGQRIQGQTSDVLRAAGLKIVSKGLYKLLPNVPLMRDPGFEPDWSKLRFFTNEPRHLLRSLPPSCSDIIIGQRLGSLAVDNAMAGYTDCMISQWLTEYVLVPLKLVVLGRKRIPDSGIFWKSILGKTGQPEDMVDEGEA